MQHAKIIDYSQFRNRKKRPGQAQQRSKPRQKGAIRVRGGKLWVDFRYLGERVRESTGLIDDSQNRNRVRKQLNLIMAEIEAGIFRFSKRFPHSKRKKYFAELEGELVTVEPGDVLFGEYVEKWWHDMSPGMTIGQQRDYRSALNAHLLPKFADRPLSEFWSTVRLKKFIQELKGKQNRYGKPLSGKRIGNIMIPLRMIVKDAASEYNWHHLHDPFAGLKLPKTRKYRVQPFTFDEWQTLLKFIPKWYHNYFQFAVQTGLRPSEQVALKWNAIDARFIYVELSRVRGVEKDDLKNEYSRREILIRPSMREVIEAQRQQTAQIDSEYVFLNMANQPIYQDRLAKVWRKAMKESKMRYRRMYDVRHTFASWALAAGELPGWVARTLGHADTSMVYSTYGRFIPNLTRQDGGAFEKLYHESTHAKGDQFGHNFGHNREN